MAPRVAFYFDLASPACYLAAELLRARAPGLADWRPALWGQKDGSLASEGEAVKALWAQLGLLALRLPEPPPAQVRPAMVGATYARRLAKGVAFAQAAFRQAFAAGRDLSRAENVLIAGAACELHPRALRRALDDQKVAAELDLLTAAARQVGVARLPALVTDGERFEGVVAIASYLEAADGGPA